MADKLITIAKFADSIEADLARQQLEDFGIKSILAGVNAANIYSGIAAFATVELQVIESQAEKALEILQSYRKQEE
jgi:hypothetical protein